VDRERARRYVVVQGKEALPQALARDPRAHKEVTMVLGENGVEESVVVVERKGPRARPWRASVDPVRAAGDTVVVGVGYLL